MTRLVEIDGSSLYSLYPSQSMTPPNDPCSRVLCHVSLLFSSHSLFSPSSLQSSPSTPIPVLLLPLSLSLLLLVQFFHVLSLPPIFPLILSVPSVFPLLLLFLLLLSIPVSSILSPFLSVVCFESMRAPSASVEGAESPAGTNMRVSTVIREL